MAKRGRPKKPGKRFQCGKLMPNQEIATPAAIGLAMPETAYVIREVVSDGQVVGQAYAIKHPVDSLTVGEGKYDVTADQWRALRAYADAFDACTVSGRSGLDMTPSGGGGIEAAMDARKAASERFRMLSRSLPAHLAPIIAAVCVRRETVQNYADSLPVDLAFAYRRLREGADCLVFALDMRHRRAA